MFLSTAANLSTAAFKSSLLDPAFSISRSARLLIYLSCPVADLT